MRHDAGILLFLSKGFAVITISRQLAKQLRGVFRRMLPRSPSKVDQTVQFVAGEDGLHARLCNRAGAVEYHLAGNSPPESLAVTLDALSACEGTRAHENVSLEACTDGGVIVRWDDRSIPRSIVAEAESVSVDLPLLPTSYVSNPPRLLAALKDAMETTEHDSMRYATNCVQLRGNDGRLAATDGGQVLCESGFTFPWEDEVLVLRPSVFASRDLPTDQAVEVGRTEHHIAVRIGPWTFWLLIEKVGRFPNLDNVIPDAATATTRLQLTEDDVRYLLDVVPRLPSEDAGNGPLTVDLNGQVALLASGGSSLPITQVVLSNSRRIGEELRWSTDRKFLSRALRLGFREVFLHGPESPSVCRDEHRTYVWALLSTEGALAPADNMISLTSPLATVATSTRRDRLPPPRRHHRDTERTTPHMPRNRIAATFAGSTSEPANGSAPPAEDPHEPADQSSSFGTVLREAEAVKTSLREVHTQVGRLIAALKRHRRQSKLMQSTLASLKQLQTLEV